MAQMKEQIKTPEKELRDEEIDKLSDAEFKTLVIRMLTEMVEFGHKMKEEMKTLYSLHFFLHFATKLNQFCEHPDYQCFELCI